MRIDSEDAVWTPVHEREVLLRGVKALVATLALLAVTTAFTAVRPAREPAPNATSVSQVP